MDVPLEQILVVVASIQMRPLKTEVEEVFVLTAVGHELAGPKMYHNCFIKACTGFLARTFTFH